MELKELKGNLEEKKGEIKEMKMRKCLILSKI
jgi:hypothetical protein